MRPGRRVRRVRPRVTKKATKRWKAKVARVAKSVTLRNLETKRYSGDITQTLIYKNGGPTAASTNAFTIFPLRNIAVGTDEGSRIGNQITLKRMNWRFVFDNILLADVKFRVTMGWIHNADLSTIPLTEVYIGGGDISSRFVRRPLDPFALFTSVIHDKVYRLDQDYVNEPIRRNVDIHIPMHNKKHNYSTNASNGGATEELVCIVTATDYIGVDLADDVGLVDGFFRVWYKDA